MTDPVPYCPLCGSTHSKFFDERPFRDLRVINRLCAICGLVYQSPHMDEAELAAFYTAEYRRLYQGQEGPDPKDLKVQRGRAEALLKFAQPYLSSVQRHLDIGCSAGLLLQAFLKAYHCAIAGVEPGEAYRQYACQQGLSVFASLDELKADRPERFDLISLAHVLEHLPEPTHSLADLRQNLLAPGGALLIEVPNLYAHDSFEVAHLISYSPHTLRQTLTQAGFAIVAMETHGRPRSRLLPLYITVLARPQETPSSSAILPESNVALKRRLGMLRRRLLTRLFPRQAWLPLEKQ